MRIERPTVSTEALVLAAATWLLLVDNAPFWRAAFAGRAPDAATWGFAAGIGFGLLGAHAALGLLAAGRWWVRPLLALLLVLGAVVSWFTAEFGICLDRSMLDNVLATRWTEASELLGWRFAGHVAATGVLPAALLWWPRLARRTWRRALLVRAAWLAAAAGVTVAGLLPVFADFASLVRNQREVRYLLTPGNAIAAASSRWLGRGRRPGAPLASIAQDAVRPGSAAVRRPRLLVLVVGETARADHFALNGYPRATNPELAQRDVLSFREVTACGSSTEVSLPCMFSAWGRQRYDEDAIRSHESVLHVLHRVGVRVLWRDNQSGCKGVCAGLPALQLAHADVESLCAEGQCFDEVLLHGLEAEVRGAGGDQLVVLHQLGSHGPAYHRRYPAAFRRFTPACESDDLRRCSTDEIRNAYDNSLLYTDHVLARTIDLLQALRPQYDTAMLYVSDHGESLGEGGLYLHGMPWAIAPRVQTHVPLVAWLSPEFARGAGIDLACLRARTALPLSHDHLFHTLLGVMDVRTGALDPALDLLQPCRSAPARSAP